MVNYDKPVVWTGKEKVLTELKQLFYRPVNVRAYSAYIRQL